ncbi:MAG: class A beta-lactamase-related serine hydrolase [Flavobacteriales bacterium]|nr:class A beta-lactamase-related serine hydrolase [Flavobacteriales bacterium]
MNQKNFVFALVATVVLSVSVTYAITRWMNSSLPDVESAIPTTTPQSNERNVFCEVELLHESQYQKIRPLLFAENACESDELSGLKKNLSDAISKKMTNGEVTRSAVYFRDLNHSAWTSVNGTETFHPASMLKLTVMMNVLKIAENNPNILISKYKIDKSLDLKELTPPSQRLILGKEYTVMELLEAMMKRSDNDANALLHKIMNYDVYTEMFVNLNIPVPGPNDFYYEMNPMDLAKFYRLIYHASYLNRNASEYALKLMVDCEFKQGLQKNLPKGADIVNKFGERMTVDGLYQCHDSGIVYLNGQAYLLVIMTEGKQFDQLKNVVADLSGICYDYLLKGK